jgi:tRNA-specific 2-thiouridylase
MSGGVDSSTAALLLLEQGYSVFGLTMRLLPEPSDAAAGAGAVCATKAVEDARAVCRFLGIEHHVVDLAEEFEQSVLDPFVEAYRRGETPNPCVRCNRLIKFGRTFDRALELGAGAVATGHYARVREEGGEAGLFRGADPKKDQSYFLAWIPRDRFSSILFPLGEWTKEAVRRFAEEKSLPVASREQSQETCFTGGEDYRALIGSDRPGEIVHIDGRVLGKHGGVGRFTIGQRKGLGIGGAGEPLFVTGIEPETGTVRVGSRSALERRALAALEPNYLAGCAARDRVGVKIRSQMEPVPAVVCGADAERFEVEFDRPVTAVTPGQYAVLYDGDRVVAAGRIASSPPGGGSG